MTHTYCNTEIDWDLNEKAPYCAHCSEHIWDEQDILDVELNKEIQ